MNNINQLTEKEISQRLQQTIPETGDIPRDLLNNECRQAGVLIPFVRINDEWHILFIRRSIFEHDRHSGQVAFVGGKHERSDRDLKETALRETQEEIGIAPNDVHILGQLNHHYTISHFQIMPTVATVPWPYPLKLETLEVAHAFTMPLAWLADKNNHEIRYRQISGLAQSIPIVYFKEYENELLWGATARMTLSLINALQHR